MALAPLLVDGGVAGGRAAATELVAAGEDLEPSLLNVAECQNGEAMSGSTVSMTFGCSGWRCP